MLALCQRTNLTPAELDEIDDDTVQQWLAVIELEGAYVKEQSEKR